VADLVLAVLAVALLLTVGVAALVGLTVAPLLVALLHAERQGASPARVGVAAAAFSGIGLLLAAAGARTGPGTMVLPLLLTWVVPVLVARAPSGARWLGRAGARERVRA
jgi:hypothetical protein